MKSHGDANGLEQQSAKRAWQTPQLARLDVAETALGAGGGTFELVGQLGCGAYNSSGATNNCNGGS